jgi:uncharacterized protein YeaO (DUF488 family)
MPILTKRIYDPPSADDGFRLLTMRLWPRGIRKDAVSAWEKELGPTRDLLDDYKKERISWQKLEKRYVDQMSEKRELLKEWMQRAKKETITLLCSCKDPAFCHRTVLKRLLEADELKER